MRVPSAQLGWVGVRRTSFSCTLNKPLEGRVFWGVAPCERLCLRSGIAIVFRSVNRVEQRRVLEQSIAQRFSGSRLRAGSGHIARSSRRSIRISPAFVFSNKPTRCLWSRLFAPTAGVPMRTRPRLCRRSDRCLAHKKAKQTRPLTVARLFENLRNSTDNRDHVGRLRAEPRSESPRLRLADPVWRPPSIASCGGASGLPSRRSCRASSRRASFGCSRCGSPIRFRLPVRALTLVPL